MDAGIIENFRKNKVCFKDLFFLLQQILDYFFEKKWNFGIIPLIFTIFRKKFRSRRHLPHLSKLTNLFWKIWVNLEQIIIFDLCSYFTLSKEILYKKE